ncbi:glycosyl transferase family 1 [Palleronia aestuarii]|uniref:Glycosyl transferase family 1 n=1 Tax=Palleronia aestuarii TaxID=568105 RepID=A0A2W7P6I1_9RHOB|nr:glycosyltransferase [Palleronia aestuarii]PZX19002.1 glycosyl transferase family 1 [Palleronia aestuarii]
MNPIFALKRAAGARRFQRPVSQFSNSLFGRTFPPDARTRVAIYYHPNVISWSLIYPYVKYEETLKERYGVALSLRPVDEFLAGDADHSADVIVVQPWFTVDPATLERALADCRSTNRSARIVFLDPSAHCDLRLGRFVAPHIDLYQRKALFKDRSAFTQPFRGDTNLVDYYSALHGLEAPVVDWEAPADLLDRLALAPNFLLDPTLAAGFLGESPVGGDRPIDLHCRLATRGSPWYQAMRLHAEEAARGIDGIRQTPDGRIPRKAFLAEMRQARLCWSPFGYGELCWRDLEAFMTGAVLVKPDMGHLETCPDLYVPGETYLPVKWDFSDLEDVVRAALDDPERCRRIAETAFAKARDYIETDRFVDEVSEHFALERPALLA